MPFKNLSYTDGKQMSLQILGAYLFTVLSSCQRRGHFRHSKDRPTNSIINH